jgi:hypothetical protein
MSAARAERLPIGLVFNPNWWWRNHGVAFDEDFYFDTQRRIRDDILMRRVLHEEFGWLGMGEACPKPRPIIGSMHVAGGFVIPALFGAEVVFSEAEAPWVRSMNMGDREVRELSTPDIAETWPMAALMADVEQLETRYGYVIGDFDIDGILNTALCLRGQQLFVDLIENPDLAIHLFDVIAATQVHAAEFLLGHTKSCSVATNPTILKIAPSMFLHSNCSVTMVSPETYHKDLQAFEKRMAKVLQPYGIHHCGGDMDRYAGSYSTVGASFFDVGWGSDVARCRELLPEAFLCLRLSPVRMQRCTPDEIVADTEGILGAVGSIDRAAICCINMDYGTPEENLRAMFDTVARFRAGER